MLKTIIAIGNYQGSFHHKIRRAVFLLEEMENDLEDMLEAAWLFDTVIIKMGEGLRIEICPLCANEEPNIKAYTKDFNIIHKYTDVQNQKNQAETDFLDAVKNNPETLISRRIFAIKEARILAIFYKYSKNWKSEESY